MLVAQVPRANAALEHGSVIPLSILHQPRILLGHKEGVGIHLAVAACQLRSPPLHFHELVDDFVFARFAESEAGGVSVRLRVLAEVFKAGIAIARTSSRFGINFLQEVEHCTRRSVQAIEIEPVETCLPPVLWQLIVVLAQPRDKLQHVSVPPHPCRKPLEGIEGLDCLRIIASALYVAVDAIRIRPVRFDRDRGKTFLLDQPLRDLRSRVIEVVRSVRSFSEKHETGVANQLHQRLIITASIGERMRIFPDGPNLQLIICFHVTPILQAALGIGKRAARRSKSRTSWSLVSEKSVYHCPTAQKGSGVTAQMIWSTSVSNSAQVEAAATGTATMIWRGISFLRASAATRIDEPVASPSSTRTTVRPRTSTGGRPSRYSRSRRSSSFSSRRTTVSTTSSGICRARTNSSFSTRTPPEAMAPMANSS